MVGIGIDCSGTERESVEFRVDYSRFHMQTKQEDWVDG